MERLLWKGPDGIRVWSVDDGARGNEDLYRITRNGATLAVCRSLRDVFALLRKQDAVA